MALMMMGTHSGAGKHFLLTGLARLLSDEGHSFTPFKGLCFDRTFYRREDGLIVSPSQAIQSIAARLVPSPLSSPIVICDHGVVVDGHLSDNEERIDFEYVRSLSSAGVRRIAGSIIAEGGGSPAEISFADDVPNIFVARLLKPQIILVGDVFYGGAFAHIKGTMDLMPADVRAMVCGLILNRAILRGNEFHFWKAVAQLEELVSAKVIGVVPMLESYDIIEEDQRRDLSHLDDVDIERAIVRRANDLREHLDIGHVLSAMQSRA